MANEVIFPKGMLVREVNGQYGNFFAVGINLKEFNEFAKEHLDDEGYINLNLCKAKTHENWYFKLSNWTHKKKENASTVKFKPLEEDKGEEEIPF